jgi:hypothetical protein
VRVKELNVTTWTSGGVGGGRDEMARGREGGREGGRGKVKDRLEELKSPTRSGVGSQVGRRKEKEQA